MELSCNVRQTVHILTKNNLLGLLVFVLMTTSIPPIRVHIRLDEEAHLFLITFYRICEVLRQSISAWFLSSDLKTLWTVIM